MHVFAFVWSGLKHCRCREDETYCTVRYQPGTTLEIEVHWNKAAGTTTSCMTNSHNASHNDTNTNMITTKINNIGTAMDLKASKLIELCQAKIDSMEENIN